MRRLTWLLSFILALSVLSVVHSEVAHAKAKTYTISPATTPINKTYTKYKGYNSSTKHYYLLTSYLEQIERNGGGTLVLKKGVYTVSNAISIPSNTTIKLQNGAVLKKGTKTGKASFAASKTFIQLVPPSKALLKNSAQKYSGAKNIKIMGSGTATIDMNNAYQTPAILMSHAQNITISGIQFKKNNNATIIHILGSKNVLLNKNKFLQASKSTKLAAIRLETASASSTLYPLAWSAADNTSNTKVKISNNTFTMQYNAIKTSDYMNGKYQNDVTIEKNKFSKIVSNTLFMTAWNKPKIANNTFTDTNTKAVDAILSRAVKYPTISKNTFTKSKNIISFKEVYLNGNVLANTNTVFSAANKKALASNKGIKLGKYFIDLPNADFVELANKDAKNTKIYTFNSKTTSLDPKYERYSTYSSASKSYYVLRSILERLEKQNGGTLIIKKGTYTLTNNLYVPSNVTIELEDGVVLKKSLATYVSGQKESASVFQLVPPSKANGEGTVGGYNGTKNVKIYSKGRATIDLQHRKFSFAIIMGHNSNITIQNIDFRNLNGGHFIEMDASKNVLIDNSTFVSNITEGNDYANEAINLDTPDLATKGFNSKWSNFDRSANLDVTIQNSKFRDLATAIGTHQISGEGIIKGVKYSNKPHKNVKIINNEFSNFRSDAIHAFNWSDAVIENNKFIDIGNGKSGVRGIISNGSYNPMYQNNYFENISRPMQFYPKKNATNATEYKEVYDELNSENLKALETNRGKNLDEYFIRISTVFKNFSNPTKINIIEE